MYSLTVIELAIGLNFPRSFHDDWFCFVLLPPPDSILGAQDFNVFPVLKGHNVSVHVSVVLIKAISENIVAV